MAANSRIIKLAASMMTPEQKAALNASNDPQAMIQKAEEIQQRVALQANFFLYHPHADRHFSGPSPSVPAPEPTKAPLKYRRSDVIMQMAAARMGIEMKSGAQNLPPGDLSRSYPVSYTFEFPTRFVLSQRMNYLDMTLQDEYGNPILCFHAYAWSFKRKLRMIDLRTGQICGKLVEEFKAVTGKYKFNLYLDSKDKKFGSITKLGLYEAPHMAARYFDVKTENAKFQVIDHVLGKPIVIPTPEAAEVEAASFLPSAIHNPFTDGDHYFVEVSPGQDIRFVAAIVVAFDKLTTVN